MKRSYFPTNHQRGWCTYKQVIAADSLYLVHFHSCCFGSFFKAAKFFCIQCVLISLLGCVNVASRHLRQQNSLHEESRALTTAVVDTLQAQPAPERDAYSTTALLFARQNQKLIGLPDKWIDVDAIIHSNQQARALLTVRFERQNKLLTETKAVERQLLDLGERKAEETATHRFRWFTGISSFLLVIGGFICLCIFCPVALPLIGHFLGWLIGKVPALAGAVGVVSVKAFDAVVRGIERSKSQYKKAGDSNGTLTNGSAFASNERNQTIFLEESLSREMDASHKALVQQRKTTLSQN